VKYELKPVGMSSVLLRTPTCSYVVRENVVLLLEPDLIKLHVNGMHWDVEQYSPALEKWLPQITKDTFIGYNSTHVWQKWVFMDDSERTLFISCNNKQTVKFVAKSPATYRVLWKFADINVTKMLWQNGTCVELKEGDKISSTNFRFSNLVFLKNESFSLSIDYGEISQLHYAEFRLGCTRREYADVELIYGNWTLGFNEALVIDPETKTFVSESVFDGSLMKHGDTYEEATSAYPSGLPSEIWAGQEYDVVYSIYRGYVSFNTSSLQDNVEVINATLRLKTIEDLSATDFVIKVMGGSQPLYDGYGLDHYDWGCGTDEVASWSSTNYPGDNTYINITIPPDQINKMGRTQFELKSEREGTAPSGPEYVRFYASYISESEPVLEISWLPQTEYVNGVYWYYWHHSSDKAAILLFGGQPAVDRVFIRSIFLQDENGKKEKLVNDLYTDGFDVLSPKRDTTLPLRYNDSVVYTTDSDIIYNATVLLLNQGYHHIFLFGYSAGGVAVAYEIQKDYASIFSAAVIASAPVDDDTPPVFPIFQSAHNASKVKTCTSFIVGVNDMQLGNIYTQMSTYFNNTNAHKEWHKWDNGHSIFDNSCLTHPNESVSDVLINWFEKHSTPLRNPSFEERLRSVYGCADWQTNRKGWRELKGDINIDGQCDGRDVAMVMEAYGSLVGEPKYNWLVDVDGNGGIDGKDIAIVSKDYGKEADRHNGSYSWYINEGGECHIWQWLNHSVALLKGKRITFEFWFKPQTFPTNGFARAIVYYKDSLQETYVYGPQIYYNQTIWYKASVTISWNLPETTTAIKVTIYGQPDFKALIDNATLTALP
jgi:hypothetical protein